MILWFGKKKKKQELEAEGRRIEAEEVAAKLAAEQAEAAQRAADEAAARMAAEDAEAIQKAEQARLQAEREEADRVQKAAAAKAEAEAARQAEEAAALEAARKPEETPAPEPVPDIAPIVEAAPTPEPVPTVEPEPPVEEAVAAETKKPGFFSKLASGMKRSSSKLSSGITGVFTKRKLDEETLEELEDLLIMSDMGTAVARRVTRHAPRHCRAHIGHDEQVFQLLQRLLIQLALGENSCDAAGEF